MNRKVTTCMRLAGALALSVYLFISGCTGKSPPSRFYTLTPISAAGETGLDRRQTQAAAIGVGPVRVADYLDQSNIVTRNENRIDEARFDLWAGSFTDNLTNVLAENLGLLLATERVFVYPWRSFIPIDYQVMVDIIRCDGRPGAEAVLVARWTILSGDRKKVLVVRRSEIREQAAGGYQGLVAAQSRLLADLSREIAGAVREAGHMAGHDE